MPYDSEGIFTRIHNWEDDRINDIDIASDRHDEEDDNFANGLSQCLLRNGNVTMTGNLNMGGFAVKNIANGQNNLDAVNKSQLDSARNTLQSAIDNAVASASVFVGDIKASLQTANHGNWLLCDGSAVSRTTYADLFALIGDGFGSGDGSTTFNLPDYRGKFLRGLGGDSALDIYTTQAEGLPNITGTVSNVSGRSQARTVTGAFTSTNYATRISMGGGENYKANGDVGFDASQSNAIYGASEHVTPVNQAVNYFIRAKV